MLTKFFKHGTGGSGGVINYLLGKDRDREHATILRGDENITSQLIDSSLFKQKYTSGCLSFEEINIPEDQKIELMNGFENLVRTEMDVKDVNFLWIEHTDKDRLELNFVIPNLHLSTGKNFTPYLHSIDLNRFNTWKNIQNIKHNFSDPNEPSVKQSLTTNSKQSATRKETKKRIHDAVLEGIDCGLIQNHKGVVALLEEGGHTVQVIKNHLSIVMPGTQRKLPLKGLLYEQSFSVSGLNNESVKDLQRQYKESTARNYAECEQRYSQLQQTASRRNEARYRRKPKASEGLRRETGSQNIPASRLDERPDSMVNHVNISSARDIIHHARDMVSKQRNIHHHDTRNAPVLRKLEELRQSHDRNRENAPEELGSASRRLSNSIFRAKQTNELTGRLDKLSSKKSKVVKRRCSLDTQRIRSGNREKTADMRYL